MSYYIRNPQRPLDKNHDFLVEEIKKEFENEIDRLPDPVIDVSVPLIIEDHPYNSDRLHVYVIWDKWSQIREEHRASAIIDAYELKFGLDIVKRLSIVLGLFLHEAVDMGVLEGKTRGSYRYE